MIRYFKADVDDAHRIAIVEADDDDSKDQWDNQGVWDGIPECDRAMGALELTQDELPADFADWKQYTAHAYNSSPAIVVRVMSKNGD